MPTKIEWTNETWNPVTGCTPVSEGCANCYAKRMAKRLAGRAGYPKAPHEFDVTLHPDRLNQPYHWRKPRKVFVCSMSDLFHEDVPEEYIVKVFATIAINERHTFQILTKRPKRMYELFKDNYIFKKVAYYIWDGPDNLAEHQPIWMSKYGFVRPHVVASWLSSGFNLPLKNLRIGVTTENQQTANERIPWLLKTPAAVRFVSVEPMLGQVHLTKIHYKKHQIIIDALNGHKLPYDQSGYGVSSPMMKRELLHWVICGGETGYGAREMKAEWAQDLYQQCKNAGVPFFFKKPGDAFKGNTEDLPMVREWPKRE
jgi:protein gp37